MIWMPRGATSTPRCPHDLVLSTTQTFFLSLTLFTPLEVIFLLFLSTSSFYCHPYWLFIPLTNKYILIYAYVGTALCRRRISALEVSNVTIVFILISNGISLDMNSGLLFREWVDNGFVDMDQRCLSLSICAKLVKVCKWMCFLLKQIRIIPLLKK